MAIDNTKEVLVKNRYKGTVGYDIPEMHISRTFKDGGEQMIPWEELKALYQSRGGDYILENYLVITDDEAAKELLPDLEPEYFYTKDQVIKLLNGDLDAFLDMLDFAPKGVIDLIKDCAVDIEVNDTNKRDAILKKTGFDVTNAIKIKNTKSEEELAGEVNNEDAPKKRRVGTSAATTPKRRVATPKSAV